MVGSDYCSFTKAIEHLGDRWSLVIVRDLLLHRRLGFNALAGGLPGVSRSVLASRLRKLEQLGLLEREPGLGRRAAYRLTPSGRQLEPALRSLWEWSLRWLPEDPSMAEHDPGIITAWLCDRALVDRLPERRAVLQIDLEDHRAARTWLVVERGVEPSVCIEDPMLPPERYVYLEACPANLYPVARGLRPWRDALDGGTVRLFGEPTLVSSVAEWFEVPAG